MIVVRGVRMEKRRAIRYVLEHGSYPKL